MLIPFRSILLLSALLLYAGTTPSARSQPASEHTAHYRAVILNAPFPGVDQTMANGINNFGIIVGSYHDAAGPHGFRFAFGTYTAFNVPFSGAQNTTATAINDEQEVVGWYTSNGLTHSFLLRNGNYTSFDYPASGVTLTVARGINDLGQIVGTYDDANGSHGFLFEQGQYKTLDVPFSGASNTTAAAINNRGEIVGAYVGSDSLIHGFLKKKSNYIALDMPGATETQPYGINDREQIVGYSFFYDDGVFTPLSTLSSTITTGGIGLAINDLGKILASSPSLPNSGILLIPR